jgi:uncharacterized protein DUF4389
MYPVTYAAANPGEGRNRLTTFFRYIVAIPWLIVGALYGLAASFAAIAAWFAIVFTGEYPPGIYDFVAGYARFQARVYGFIFLATDEWPPFHGNVDDAYPVRLGIPERKAEYDRLKTGLRFIFGIPVLLLAWVQNLIATVISLIGWFMILFTGRISDDLFQPLRSALAYQARATVYFLLVTEDWPPFSLEEQGTGTGQLPPTPPSPAPPSEESGTTPRQESGG